MVTASPDCMDADAGEMDGGLLWDDADWDADWDVDWEAGYEGEDAASAVADAYPSLAGNSHKVACLYRKYFC